MLPIERRSEELNPPCIPLLKQGVLWRKIDKLFLPEPSLSGSLRQYLRVILENVISAETDLIENQLWMASMYRTKLEKSWGRGPVTARFRVRKRK